VLFWHLLTSGHDYAFGQPTLTHKKIRQMELAAGAPSLKGHRAPNPTGLPAPERREQERAAAAHAEHVSDDSSPTGNRSHNDQRRLDFHPSVGAHN
jgi:hypothetical protein